METQQTFVSNVSGGGFNDQQRSMWQEMTEQMERRKQEWEEQVCDLKKDFLHSSAPDPEGDQHVHKVVLEDPGREKVMKSMFYEKGDLNGDKTFRVCFNVCQFKPEEVSVKAADGRLVVQARHEEIHDGNTVSREFSRKVDLPPGVDPQSVRSSISKDGILEVEADVSSELLDQNSNEKGGHMGNLAPSSRAMVGALSTPPTGSTQKGLTTYTDPQTGLKMFKVTVDMGPEFQPEDLQVKSVARKLMVHARHEEKVQGRTSCKEFNREFDLPDEVDPGLITANMTPEGQLVLEAPFKR